MPLSHPARTVAVEPPTSGFAEPLGFAGFCAVEEARCFVAPELAFFALVAAFADRCDVAEEAGAEASDRGLWGVRERGVRAPAGFAGRRGLRADSSFIALLNVDPETTTGAATRPPPSLLISYAITP